MAFFVVERKAADSVLVLPLPEEFPTREAALAALSAATAAGRVTITGEIFIADLGSAVPVLVMSTAAPESASVAGAAPPVPAEPPIATADEPVISAESLTGSGPEETAAAGSAAAAWGSVDRAGEDELSLADALKRAATSLEDEGIVAPESIDAVPAGEEAPEDVPVASAPTTVSEPMGVTSEDSDADTAAWPWANVEAYEISDMSLVAVEDEAEAEEASGATSADHDVSSTDVGEMIIKDALVPDPPKSPAVTNELDDLIAGLEEPRAETGTIITSAPAEGEDAYLPKPVILGDYADASDEENVAAVEEAQPSEPGVAEPATSTGELQPVASVGESTDSAPAEDPGEVVAATVIEGGYEVTGELDLASYTCQDCVYSNTCPKVGEVVPADCGSFQWRSE